MKKQHRIDVWLEQLNKPMADRDYQPGHQRMHALIEATVLHRPLCRIRIAGTNGKGSTAHMLAAALQSAGLKVGLFTSPHVLRYNERIKIQGQPIGDQQLLDLLESLVPDALRTGASYFETSTLLALKAFSDAQVDVEILEAGVGARFDSTTAVSADVALMTPVGLDHQDWLGETLEDIAREKGWVAHGCRSFFSVTQLPEVEQILSSVSPSVVWVSSCFSLPLAMPGEHQKINASLALEAAKACCNLLDRSVADECLSQAIAKTVVPGRLQHVQWQGAGIWLDAAHNLHAVKALLPVLRSLADPFDAILVFTREDRSLIPALPLLKGYTKRLMVDKKADQNHGFDTVGQALEAVLKANAGAKILVLGSFITLAQVHAWFEEAADA